MSELCPMCDEPIDDDDLSPTVLHTPEGPKNTHRTCMLREVTGGIGHHIAHEYWCTLCGDPDAGLTRRQSALLVDAYIRIVGIKQPSKTGDQSDIEINPA